MNFRNISENIHRSLKRWACSAGERWHGSFMTVVERPMFAASVNTRPDALSAEASLGLVMQGPIVKKFDFTLETVKIYKKHFRDTRIILSTWDSEDREYLKKFADEQIEVVLNADPACPGTSNINRQIVSSSAGVNKAAEGGCRYVLKTRTDQRLYASDAKETLINLLRAFPVKPGSKQKGRIIGASLNTFKYRLYGLSDMLTFGWTEDMLAYWGCPLDERRIPAEAVDFRRPMKDVAKVAVCEVYLATEFLKKIGRPLAWTLKDSWRVFADHFCVVDQQSLDLYWYKYRRHEEYRWPSYDATRNSQELNFAGWLNLYAGLDDKIIPERAAEAGFKEKI